MRALVATAWRYAVIGYAVGSSLGTIYLLKEIDTLQRDHTAMRVREEQTLTLEDRLLQVEKLWGISPCQGATLEYNK
jgi:hypothetical protein